MCIVRVDGGAIGSEGLETECGVRTRKADARWCMCGPRGSCACSGTVSPPLSRCPTPFSAIYTYIRVRGVCELSMAEERFVLCRRGVENVCSEGIQNMTARGSMHAT